MIPTAIRGVARRAPVLHDSRAARRAKMPSESSNLSDETLCVVLFHSLLISVMVIDRRELVRVVPSSVVIRMVASTFVTSSGRASSLALRLIENRPVSDDGPKLLSISNSVSPE